MNDQLVVMNKINRLIKDLEVLSCRQLFNMALSDILDIVLRDNIQNVVDEIKNPMKARLLLVKKDLEQIDAGFYDDYPARIIKYWLEVHRLLKQQNLAD